MSPEASTLAFEQDFSLPPSRAHRVDRAIARYPLVADEIVAAPRESLVLRFRKTWLGDFCYELPGWLWSLGWGLRIACRMSGRKG